MRKVVGALAVPVENNVIAQPHLPTPPNNYGLLTNLAVAELVISAVCEKSKIDEAEFWKAVREEARKQHLRLSAKIEVRSGFVKMRQLASVLDGDALEKLVRGEGLVTRAFYKALHELQRLQAARLHDAGHPPVALDLQG